MHRRVAAARTQWARVNGWQLAPDGEPSPGDVALALPRSWRVAAARGRIRRAIDGREQRIQTWALRPVPGSRRREERREIVAVECPTGDARFATSNVPTIDPLTVMPAWATPRAPEPAWADRVREVVRAHRDQTLSLSVSDGRIVVLAVDDPRPETSQKRLDLALAVARIVA